MSVGLYTYSGPDSEYETLCWEELTEELGEPEGLVVVLHGDGARVEEDEDDDEPEPPLLLAHPPHPELELLQGQHQACAAEQTIDITSNR